MGEIKSVKVDNWGVFFLQKLQNFFNKTDYCDLTLQFDDNSQLKVHRLVLSACTDYFNVLEQTYDVTDDILIMPRELQADVVVPIVNFMYTGTLEFEINMYGRLLKTAKDMNMTVLLKLLEAHKRTVEGARVQNTARAAPKNNYNTQKKMTPIRSVRPVERTYSATPSSASSVQHHTSTPQQQRRVQTQPKITQYKNIQIKPVSSGISTPYRKPLPDAAAIVVKYPHSQTTVKGPSRFDCADEILLPPDSFESSFDNISYESKPLITATQIIKEERDMDDYDQLIQQHTSINQSSPFEQLRKSYTGNSNKRPPSTDSSMGSPPEKKPNIQDVKEYAEQQRMRKQITAEYDDDHEYDDVLDDEFHHDDDDEDYVPPASYQKQQTQQKVQQKSIVVKQDADRKSTIVLKNSGPDTDHAKIISEVLKKYPHLVKKPDSVKFQIMTKSGKTTQRLIIKEEPASTQPEVKKSPVIPQQAVVKPKPVQQTTPQPSTSKAVSAPAAPVAPTQPKRIDSKTMHALIALGAENTTGPWLCLKCGVNGRPISIPSYRGFRRHLINTHKEKIDPRLCEYCGWRSRDNRELIHHLLVKHSVKPPATYDFPSCEVCSEILLNEEALTQHMELSHPEYKENYNNCMYCNKQFENNTIMYNHVRAKHKEQAQEDGVIEYSDNDDSFDTDAFVAKQLKHEKHPQNTESNEKVKIISDISLKKEIPIIKTSEVSTSNKLRLPESSEAEALNNVANSIATSLGLVDNATAIDGSQILPTEYINTEMENIHTDFDKKVTKILASDGSVMELTDAQREEIISQLDDQHSGEVVMVLNQESFNTESTSSPVTTQTFGNGDDSMFIVYSESAETEKSKSNELGTKSAVKNVTKDSAGEVKKANENTISSDIEWQDPTVSEIFDGNADETSKQMDTSVEDSLDASDDVNNMNESEDNIERVIREMDQGLTPEKPKSKTGKTEDRKDSVDEKENMKGADEMKKNKVELLTGDWSDDDEEEVDCDKQTSSKSKDETKTSAVDKKESVEILFEVSVSNPSPKSSGESKITGDKVKTDGKTVKTEATEQTDNEVKQEKEDEEDESAEKSATETSERRISQSEDPLLEEDSDSKTIKEESKSDTDECKLEEKNVSKTSIETEANSSTSDKKEAKAEISNLINDWGDEDDEEI